MTDALFADSLPIPLEAQIKCLEREIDMRLRVYPRLVHEHKMTQRKADEEIAGMRAALRTLQGILESAA